MGTLKYAILGLLNRNEMTGYELSKEFETTLFEFWNAKHSQIYPELKSLNAEGLIQYRVEITGNVLEKKVYTITDEGRRDFSEWEETLCPIQTASKDESRLRLFFLDGASPDFQQRFLADQLSQHQKHLEHLLENQKNLMKSRLRMTARFRIISSCAARCAGKKLRCSGFRNASSSAGSGLRNQKIIKNAENLFFRFSAFFINVFILISPFPF